MSMLDAEKKMLDVPTRGHTRFLAWQSSELTLINERRHAGTIGALRRWKSPDPGTSGAPCS